MILWPALALTVLASALAVVTRWQGADPGCEGALCALSCDEDDAGRSRCPRPLVCVGDRCEVRVETCSKAEPVEGCVCSAPWVVSEGRCVDPFVGRVCARSVGVRSAELFEETCEASPVRCSQLLRLEGAQLRGMLEAAPVRSTQPWDGTLDGLPRVDRWLAEHERSSLYGGEALVIAVAAPVAAPRRSRRRGAPPRAVADVLRGIVGEPMRERLVVITVPPDDGSRDRTLAFAPGTVTLVGFPCVAREEPQ